MTSEMSAATTERQSSGKSPGTCGQFAYDMQAAAVGLLDLQVTASNISDNCVAHQQ